MLKGMTYLFRIFGMGVLGIATSNLSPDHQVAAISMIVNIGMTLTIAELKLGRLVLSCLPCLRHSGRDQFS